MSLNDLFKSMMKYLWLIVLFGIIGVFGAYFFKTPSSINYQATSQILVFPKKETIISTATLNDLALSKNVVAPAVKKFNKLKSEPKLKVEDVIEKLQSTGNGNSQIITLTLINNKKSGSLELIDYITEELVEKAKSYLPTTKVEIVSKPTLTNQETATLSTKKRIVFGGVAGVLLGIVFALMILAYHIMKNKKTK